MERRIPNTIWVYRLIHLDNVEYLLRHGIVTSNHKLADPNYINIGDTGLITQRNDYPVGINPPNGILGDYVPFYFGILSPMLLNIKTGMRGITQRNQSEIAYICCKLQNIIQQCKEWCFTDGHAKNRITTFYNNIESLIEVDWDIVNERYWHNTEHDFDRMRRKQAEFLVKTQVPVNCISSIVVFNEQIKTQVENIINGLTLSISVFANPQNKFYY